MSLQYPKEMERASRMHWSRALWCAMLWYSSCKSQGLTSSSWLMDLCFDSSSFSPGLCSLLGSWAKWLAWQWRCHWLTESSVDNSLHMQTKPWIPPQFFTWKVKYVCRDCDYMILQGPSWDTWLHSQCVCYEKLSVAKRPCQSEHSLMAVCTHSSAKEWTSPPSHLSALFYDYIFGLLQVLCSGNFLLPTS